MTNGKDSDIIIATLPLSLPQRVAKWSQMGKYQGVELLHNNLTQNNISHD